MAYVTPNSTLQLFKGINLDNRYLHTILFEPKAATQQEPAKTAAQVQDEWFTSKATSSLTFNNLMYRRYGSNAVKIEVDANSLLGVTYLRFKNTRAGSGMWFYAFVNYVDYINENTSVIYYEIDVMQTWFIQKGSIRPCMVIREHVSDDTFSTHLESEPIGSEVYDMDFLTSSGQFNSYSLIINSSAAPDSDDYSKMVNNDLICGTSYRRVVRPDLIPSVVADYMEQALGSWDKQQQSADILDLFTFPTAYSSPNKNDNIHDIDIVHPNRYDSYVPKNNKLYAYPYSFLYMTTKDGSNAQYRWEYFDGDATASTETDPIQFTSYGNPLGGGTIICYPHTPYNGVADNQDVKCVMNDFPKNSYAYDAYQAWVANGGKTKLEKEQDIVMARGVTGTISSVANALVQTVSGIASVSSYKMAYNNKNWNGEANMAKDFAQIGGRMVHSYADVANSIIDYAEAQNKIDYQWNDARYIPNIVVGTSTPNVNVALQILDFYFYNVHVRDDEAKKIDDFFSAFGYSCNKVKAPNLSGRQYWNFVQTDKAEIAGDMPSSSKAAIARIFDGGITLWHNGDQVGNYAQSVTDGTINNPIVT